MTSWNIINSPLTLTIITLIWGSIITSWITASWQKRAHRHEMKLECAKNILLNYHEYIRLLKGSPEHLIGKEYDSVSVRLQAEVKIAKLIFTDKEIAQNWKSVAGALANAKKLIQEKHKLAGEKLDDVYHKAEIATELMFKELA